jgi:hypothetical protein
MVIFNKEIKKVFILVCLISSRDVKGLRSMKKIIMLPIALLLSLMLITPTIAQPTVNSTWVMMHGRVEYYGANRAFGWCGAYAKIKEWAEAFAAWMPQSGPQIPEKINFYAARLVNTTLVELNYGGADLYIEGLWNVYNVTYIFQPGVAPGNYTLIIELVVDHGKGTLSVTGNWADFTVAIAGIDDVRGKVIHHAVRSMEPIPIGDVSGPELGTPDNAINIMDLVHAARAYGLPPGINFDFSMFSMDFNFDFKIDIIDLTTIAVNIGESY